MAVLELTLDVLLSQVPHDASGALQDLGCTKELRSQLDALEAVRKGRKVVLQHASEVQGLTRTIQLDKLTGKVGIVVKNRVVFGTPGVEFCELEPSSLCAKAGVVTLAAIKMELLAALRGLAFLLILPLHRAAVEARAAT